MVSPCSVCRCRRARRSRAGVRAGNLVGKLRTYPSVYRCTTGELSDRGLMLLPTFVRPHYTVVLPDLGAIDALATALGRLLPNPYAEA